MTNVNPEDYEQNGIFSGEKLFTRAEAWLILIIGGFCGFMIGWVFV